MKFSDISSAGKGSDYSIAIFHLSLESIVDWLFWVGNTLSVCLQANGSSIG